MFREIDSRVGCVVLNIYESLKAHYVEKGKHFDSINLEGNFNGRKSFLGTQILSITFEGKFTSDCSRFGCVTLKLYVRIIC